MPASSPTHRFRPATNSDGPAILALVFDVLREYALQPDPGATDADIADIEANYLHRGGWFEVIEDTTGSVVGCAGLYPLGEGMCELRKMYLRPQVRGHGLGKQLLQHALDTARASGFRRVTLETAKVLKEAIDLYTRFGFKPSEGGVHSDRCDQAYAIEL